MPSDLNQEIELKLVLDPADLDRLRAHPVLAEAGPGTTARLETTYFDTPKHRLWQAGLSLRVRSGPDGHVQTVKAGREGGAGLFERPEWQSPVAGPAPEAEALKDTPVWDLLGSARVRRGFEPLFTVAVERTTWRLDRPDGAVVEVTLDEGEVRAGTAQAEPVLELELELRAGGPEALFEVARALSESVPLRIGVRAKAERGHALIEADRPLAARAEPVVLPRRVDAGRGFNLLVQACLRHLWLNVGPVLATRDPEALHQARVAMRRLRSVLKLFKPMVEDESYLGLAGGLRAVSRRLGEARNLDVFIAGLAGDEPAGDDLRARAEEARQAAYDAVLAALRDPRFGRLTLDLLAWSLGGPWTRSEAGTAKDWREAPLSRVAATILEARTRRVRRKARDLARLTPPERHRVRIAAKTLRYAAEFFASLDMGGKAKRRQAAFAAALEGMQDSLGALSDLAARQGLVATLGGAGQPAGDAGAEDGAADAHEARLLAEAERAQEAFASARPFWR